MYMYRRLASIEVNSARQSQDEPEPEPPPSSYEMISRKNSQHLYTTIESGASAPAPYEKPTKPIDKGRKQPLAPPISIGGANDYADAYPVHPRVK